MSGGHPLKSLTRLGDLDSFSVGDDGIDQLLAQQAAFLQQQRHHSHYDEHDVESEDEFPASKPAATVIRTTAPPLILSSAATKSSVPSPAIRQQQSKAENQAPIDACASVSVTPTSSSSNKPAKKPSLFAQRRAAAAAAASRSGPTNDPSTLSASLREKLPPVEQVTVAVTKPTIAERTGAVSVPVAPNPTQFPRQESGFPQAAHRSLDAAASTPKDVRKTTSKRLADQIAEVFAPATDKLHGEDQAIHQDALQYLADLEDSELEAAQDHYLSALSPQVVAMLQRRAEAKYAGNGSVTDTRETATPAQLPLSSQPHPPRSPSSEIPEPEDPAEQAKLEWTRPLSSNQFAPLNKSTADDYDRDPNDPLTNAPTLPGASHRFDFAGNYIPPTTDIPSHLGLHHHSDDPLDAGYSIPELVHLLHSRFPGQRQVAAKALGGIVDRLWMHYSSGMDNEVYPVAVHNEVLECFFESDAAVHLSGLVADTNVSVAVQALEAVRSLVHPGMEAVDLDPWAGVHLVAVDPVVKFADEDDDDDEGDNGGQARVVDTYADHRRNLRANIAGGLVSLGLVPTLCNVIIRANEKTKHLAIAVLAALCVQLHEACAQVLEQPSNSLHSLLELVFDQLSSTSWPPSGPTSGESIDQITTILHLIRIFVLHDPKSMDRISTLRSGVETNLLKFLALSTISDSTPEASIASAVQATMQLVIALYSYGMPVLVPEVLQMLFDHHRGHPGSYAIASAVRLHLDEVAILTVPLVDDAFLRVGTLTDKSVERLATSGADQEWEVLVQAAQLVASRRVPAPVKDAPAVVKALCEVIVDNLPIASDDDDENTSSDQAVARSHFALFPRNIAHPYNALLDLPLQLLESLLRYLADDSLSTLAILDAVRSSLILPVLTSPDASLSWSALCAPVFLAWLKYADLEETNDPLAHLVAYYALTFLRTPMDQTVAQLALHLATVGGNVWSKAISQLDTTVPQRDTLFIALAPPARERSWPGFPGSVLSRTWLTKLAVANADDCIPLLTQLTQWHQQVGVSPTIRWLESMDLAPLFANPSAPYLTHPAQFTHLAVAATASGSGWPSKLDMVSVATFDDLLYAFFNTSFYARAFQVYLIGVLFGPSTSTPASLRAKFLSQVIATRGAVKRLSVTSADAPGLKMELEEELKIGHVEGNEVDRKQVVDEVERGLVAVVQQGLPNESLWWTAVVGQLKAISKRSEAGSWFQKAVEDLGVL